MCLHPPANAMHCQAHMLCSLVVYVQKLEAPASDGSNIELLLHSALPEFRPELQDAHLQPPAHNVQRVSHGLPGGASHRATAQAGDDAQLTFVLQLCSRRWVCRGLEASVQCCVQLQRMPGAKKGAARGGCM